MKTIFTTLILFASLLCFGQPAQSECAVSNLSDDGEEIGVWLIEGPYADNYLFEVDGSFVQYEDGTAQLTGTVVGESTGNTLDLTVNFENGSNWSEWSAMGRGYKDEPGVVGDNYLNYRYYEISSSSTMTVNGGEDVLMLTHAPLSFYYGFQVGLGANATTAVQGLGGWFHYTSAAGSGQGDILAEGDCPFDVAPCAATAATISTTSETTICAGDGIDDLIDVSIDAAGSGTNSAWIITDSELNILGLPASPPFNLEGAGAGTCLIWYINSEDDLTGATVGENAADLGGCFALSNSIAITRLTGDDCPDAPCEATAATISTTSQTTFCTDDDITDDIVSVTIDDAGMSSNATWVITAEDLTILGLPAGPEFNFDGVPAGTCLIWLLNHEDDLTGAVEGMSAADLGGCFALSNSIAVTRLTGDDCPDAPCEATAATISTTSQTTFCTDDDITDDIVSVTIDDAGMSSNATWVITAEDLTILGLPAGPEFNFDGVPAGTCLIWLLNHEDDLTGAVEGMSAADLGGCFALSNSIAVTRLTGDDCPDAPCEATAATISTTSETTICAGDGVDDLIDVSIDVAGSGTNGGWIITDSELNILGLPASPPFNLEGAGAGTCLIWFINSEDDLTGATVGENAADLGGCFALSNSIAITRLTGDDCPDAPCEATSATISTTSETTICAGDGIDDLIDVSIDVAGSGTNGGWIITDSELNILGLPASPPFNLEGAEAGTCLIWYINSEDDLTGATVGENAADLGGCFALSNSIAITRLTGDDCPNEFDCPDIMANFGDACDDGDGNTENDMIQVDCSCAGVDNFDCPDLMANIGDPCDDEDPNTSFDEVTDLCDCLGLFDDMDNDGVADNDDNCPATSNPNQEDLDGDEQGDACDDDIDGDGVANALDCDPTDVLIFEGATCDDGDSDTENDMIGEECECAGTLIDADGDGIPDSQDVCPGFNDNLLGTACDDGNPNTENDIFADCDICEGTPVSTGCTAGLGLESVIVEKYYVSDANDATDDDGGSLPAGSVTYRVYLDMAEGYKLETVFGSGDHPLVFGTTTEFFNNEDRGEISGNAIGTNRLGDNTVALDSWLSFGNASNGHYGIPKNLDTDGSVVGGANNDGGSEGIPGGLLVNNDSEAGIPLTTADGLLPGDPIAMQFVGDMDEITVGAHFGDENAAGDFTSVDGAYAVLGGVPNPAEGIAPLNDDNLILIGQFTTDGVFSFELNFRLGSPEDANEEFEQYVSSNPMIISGTDVMELTCSELTYSSAPGGAPGLANPIESTGGALRAYPNPTNGEFMTLELSNMPAQGETVVVEMVDAFGHVIPMTQFVNEKESSSRTLDFETDLSNGIYMLTVKYDGNLITQKVIVSK